MFVEKVTEKEIKDFLQSCFAEVPNCISISSFSKDSLGSYTVVVTRMILPGRKWSETWTFTPHDFDCISTISIGNVANSLSKKWSLFLRKKFGHKYYLAHEKNFPIVNF